MYPGVEVKGTFKESPDAITALLKSTAQIGLMSRSILASEVKELADGFGYKPSWIPVLVNAVAIIVNKSNPISGLSLKQLDAIYSKSLKRGASSTYEKWGELGVEGELGKQRLEVYSRASNTTDHKFFLEEALLNGEMRPEVRECSSSADLVKRVAHNAAAIGFCGLDAISDDVRTLPLGTKDAEFFTPQESNIRSGAYPISRQFVMVFNRKPGQDTDPLTYEFLRFVLSMEGQAVVVEKGCFPISHEDMRKAFRIID
jgi:phosphate transport system substrate-binding protein